MSQVNEILTITVYVFLFNLFIVINAWLVIVRLTF